MSLIIPGLFLGNIDDALNEKFLEYIHCDIIINCTVDLPYCKNYDKCERYRIPVNDDLSEQAINYMSKTLFEVVPRIHEWLENGKVVLVHCAAGMQRSAIVVFCYLVYRNYIKNNISVNTTSIMSSLNYLRQRRPLVFKFGEHINFKNSAVVFFNGLGK